MFSFTTTQSWNEPQAQFYEVRFEGFRTVVVKIQSSVMLYGDELIRLLDPADGGSTILQNLSKQSTIRKNVYVCVYVCV